MSFTLPFETLQTALETAPSDFLTNASIVNKNYFYFNFHLMI
ncbi:hypothetical protein Q7O_004483 [Pectobacterium carotovorum subsp. carotovorum PCCS1]|nr:hypothetical protein [Pectobacterium carotovorum subsp. carotovorum PCCS1]